MKKLSGRCLGSFALLPLLFVATRVIAETGALSAAGVYLISSENGSTCATGFSLGGNRLITNAHVMRSLCAFGQCLRASVSRAAAIGAPAREKLGEFAPASANYAAGLDLAWVDLPFAIEPIARADEVATATRGTSVRIVGYPACAAQRTSSGHVDESGVLHLDLTATGNYGSSGSPVFTAAGVLIGVVDQAREPIAPLLSRITRRDFEVRAVRLDKSIDLFSLTALQLASREIELLLDLYKNDVQQRAGLDRVFAGARFAAMVSDFSRALIAAGASQDMLLPLSFLDQPLSSFNFPVGSPLHHGALMLAIAESLESRGLKGERLEPLDPREATSRLSALVASADARTEIAEMIGAIDRPNYPGFYLFAARYLVLGIAITLLVLPLWGFTIGQVYTRARGGFFWRTFVATIVGLFWPFSLPVFWILYWKK